MRAWLLFFVDIMKAKRQLACTALNSVVINCVVINWASTKHPRPPLVPSNLLGSSQRNWVPDALIAIIWAFCVSPARKAIIHSDQPFLRSSRRPPLCSAVAVVVVN